MLLWNVKRGDEMTATPRLFVAWCTVEHRRLEILGDSKVVINWMNGAWEVKGEERTAPLCVVWLINLCGGTWVELSGRGHGCATKLDPLKRFLMVHVC